MNIAKFIDDKAKGREHSPEAITEFCQLITASNVDEAQIGAWLMAVMWRGMTARETTALTVAMANSGRQLDLSGFPGPVVDKHSTGGVGDKVTIIIAPLLAAAGLFVPKLSGKGLGHTGGTIDKLHAIPGFSCDLTVDAMIAQAGRIGVAIGAQTPELAPLDGRLYATRDVTGTVASIPLISASIMSKKLAAGAPTIVLDVTCGRGAFMGNLYEARALTQSMVAIGLGAGRKVSALITDMDQPLGQAVGNAIEVHEAIMVLSGAKEYPDVRKVVLELGALTLVEAGLATDRQAAQVQLESLLDNGKALAKFQQLVEAQGGDPAIADDPVSLIDGNLLYRSQGTSRGGWIKSVDPMAIALASLELGAGRHRKGDTIDYAVGIEVLGKVGDRVNRGQSLIHAYARTSAGQHVANQLELTAFEISEEPAYAQPIVLDEFVSL